MKLQGKMTGAFAGFVGYIDDTPAIDPQTCSVMLTIRYKDAGVTRFKDYKTIAEFNADWEDYTEPEPPTEPEPDYLVAKIQELENSVKELDERLKTAEEITERLLREDNEQIIGKVKSYKPGIPPREKFKRMKQDLREWIEKNNARTIQTCFHTEPYGREGVKFIDKTNAGDNRLTIIGWPTVGLVDGWTYTPEELLITGEAGEE